MDKRLVRFSKLTVYGFTVVIAAFLTVTSLIYVIDPAGMKVGHDNILWGLCVTALSAACMELVYRLAGRHVVLVNRILFAAAAVYSVAAGWYWITISQSLPAGDQKSIYDIAVRAMNHDLLPVAPEGSYLSLWPFQSGIILIYETILRVFPEADHLTIQLSNLPFVLLMVVSGTFLVKRVFASERAVTYWLLLTPFCLPYTLYVNFMYGEIPSIGLLFFAAWMLAESFREETGPKRRLLCEFLCVGSASLAVIYRKNSLIFVVACVLVLGVVFVAQRRLRPLILGAAILCVCLAAGALPRKLYEHRAGNTMGEGVPAIAYLAMGMQEGGAAPGWWNGYHSNLYVESGYDAEKVKEESARSVRESLSGFAKDPGYAASFYYRKLITQWCDGNYSCFYGTSGLFGERTPLAWDIYEGRLHGIFLSIMNSHQSVVYAGFLCFGVLFLWSKIRRRTSLEDARIQTPDLSSTAGRASGMQGTSLEEAHIQTPDLKSTPGCPTVCEEKGLIASGGSGELVGLLLPITVTGGFLFSILWEGSSRYVMPYMVMMMPFAAGGFAGAAQAARKALSIFHSDRHANHSH